MNATRTDIVELLREGHSNAEITRRLRVDKHRVANIRRELGLPNATRQPLTLEQKWAANTQPVKGGHLRWTGERGASAGTPVMRYKEESYSPAAIAFRIRHGREPEGYAFAECGLNHCVAPDHVDDQPGRARTREQLRYLTGGRARPELCCRGHDQSVHGLYESDGRAYCGECKRQLKAVHA
ncbi:hypothetical protein U9R90_25095 [Streptomyces sp. E11-3]|uniref:hypothetical protein n=1 Tax=Streptomyces sp. E11-3 TaxID=3110112 RepID=UPI00398141B0